MLYFKESEQIEDLLTMMGAPHCSLELMETKVYKDLRNRANRATNCETANIDKLVRLLHSSSPILPCCGIRVRFCRCPRRCSRWRSCANNILTPPFRSCRAMRG